MSESDQHMQDADSAEADFFSDPEPDPERLADPMGVARAAHERARKRRSRALVFLLVVLALGLVLVYWLYEDLFYFLKSEIPTELGLSYEIKPRALVHNEFVNIRGIARDMCIRAEVASSKVRFLYFLGPGISRHILVESKAGEGEGCLGAEDRSFSGRLLDLERTSTYDSVVAYYRSHFPAAPRSGPFYLLQEGARPRSSWWVPLLFVLVLVLWTINARTFLRLRPGRVTEQGGSR